MINKKKKTGMYILMALITVLVVFPFIWMLVLSFKSNSEILSTPLSLPKAINFATKIKHIAKKLNLDNKCFQQL